MFCPKCDRVYLKAKICPHCGVKLLRATGKPDNKKVLKPKTNDKVAAEICCPQCGSTNYRVRRHIKYGHNIRKGSLLVTVMFAVVYIYFFIRGGNRTYCCCECGHEWYL